MRELIPKNPCDGVHLPKIRQKKKRPTITDTEARKLFEVCKGHHYWIAIPILLMCGMRKGELLALTWDDVFQDEDTGQWYISINKKVSASKGKHTVEKFMKTLEGYRNVAIPQVLVDLMFYYKEHTTAKQPNIYHCTKATGQNGEYKEFQSNVYTMERESRHYEAY